VLFIEFNSACNACMSSAYLSVFTCNRFIKYYLQEQRNESRDLNYIAFAVLAFENNSIMSWLVHSYVLYTLFVFKGKLMYNRHSSRIGFFMFIETNNVLHRK
jgi:hypothetical protein